MIYVLSILDDSFVKVGFTASPVLVRIAELQTGSPFEIKPLLAIQGTLMQEKALHASLSKAFARIRIPMPPNEWYPGRNTFMKEFIEHLKYGFDMGLSFAEKYNSAIKQLGDKGGGRPLEPNYKWATFSKRDRYSALRQCCDI